MKSEARLVKCWNLLDNAGCIIQRLRSWVFKNSKKVLLVYWNRQQFNYLARALSFCARAENEPACVLVLCRLVVDCLWNLSTVANPNDPNALSRHIIRQTNDQNVRQQQSKWIEINKIPRMVNYHAINKINCQKSIIDGDSMKFRFFGIDKYSVRQP